MAEHRSYWMRIWAAAVWIVIGLVLAACAKPQLSQHVEQITGAELIAGVGDVVLSIKKTSDLPNAFGGADVFGRQKAAGGTVVRFLGLEDGLVVLARSDVDIESDETTLSRSGLLIPNRTTTTISGWAGNTPIYGSATTTSGYTYIPPRQPNVRVNESGWVRITVNAERGSNVYVSGLLIEVVEAAPSVLRYRLLETG